MKRDVDAESGSLFFDINRKELYFLFVLLMEMESKRMFLCLALMLYY